MQSKKREWFRILFIGDICGKYGRRFLSKVLSHMRIKFAPDVVIANGENAAGGLGINRKTAFEIFNAGVDVVTGGNHIWDKKEAVDLLKEEDRIVRPLNFPASAPGGGCYIFKSRDNIKMAVISVQGRVFMDPVVDNPFVAVDEVVKQLTQKIIFIDFHAEATAEKQAMGFFLDGRVSAVLGTHTHVQTSDLRILENGTAFQSDVGMTGSLDSIIGMKKEPVINKFLTGVNQRYEVAKDDVILDMTIVDVDPATGKAVNCKFQRINENEYDAHMSF